MTLSGVVHEAGSSSCVLLVTEINERYQLLHCTVSYQVLQYLSYTYTKINLYHLVPDYHDVGPN